MDGQAGVQGGAPEILGLPERHDACMIGFIGRLDEQKGIDLVLDSEEF